MKGMDKLKTVLEDHQPHLYAFLQSQRYISTLAYLDKIEFFYINPLDENRLLDAITYKKELGDKSPVSFLDVFLAFDERIIRDFITSNTPTALAPLFWMVKTSSMDRIYSEEAMRDLLTLIMRNKIGLFSKNTADFINKDLYEQASTFLQTMDYLL